MTYERKDWLFRECESAFLNLSRGRRSRSPRAVCVFRAHHKHLISSIRDKPILRNAIRQFCNLY